MTIASTNTNARITRIVAQQPTEYPNGQAAFLFMLTSALAPLLRLSYGRMVWMALPYTLVLGLVGFFAVELLLGPATEWFYHAGWLVDHAAVPLPTPAAH